MRAFGRVHRLGAEQLWGGRDPERFWIHQSGTDFVLGNQADEVDVKHVRLFVLSKN